MHERGGCLLNATLTEMDENECRDFLFLATDPDVNDYSDCDCFVTVVLSYGINGAIMCCEGETDKLIPVEDVIGQFTADKCPSLAMKPKLFFMQVKSLSLTLSLSASKTIIIYYIYIK